MVPLDELKLRAKRAVERLTDCTICAQHCHVNRLKGELGVCRAGREAVVASYGRHLGEEDVLVGQNGSGTIFFSHCNLKCQFCQNCEISQKGEGREVDAEELGQIMLELQHMECHNINLVSPSHFVPQILEALVIAVDKGLRLPIVYNTGGYDDLDTLKLLDGIVDIYMPDIKFGDDKMGQKYAGAPRYFSVATKAVKEMHRQVGDLQVNNRNIAIGGLLIRHLVMPEDIAGTEQVVQFIANEISPNSYLHIMDQYYPAHNAAKFPPINRPITKRELRWAMQKAKEVGLYRAFC
ncbi:radical SAM protein [Desulfofalx alkaliphila]|uniref:radical SAM protein n=1 Tax=Desulfofalx alkaliphila TaxID=105483 RepID=UPI0005561DB4|nr:radical SAM protein [Desulfofalx alkaliphila]